MNILPQLEALKKFILENTKPPLTTDLLNKLAFITEQAEAHSDAVGKQDETLSRQIKEIERLMKENQDLIAKDQQRNNDVWSALAREAEELRQLHNRGVE